MNNRHKTHKVEIGNVSVGGGLPIIVQSMTNTDTADSKATASQIIELADAGSKIVRVTVNNDDSAKAIYDIKNILVRNNCNVPIVGDFHYNGHTLLNKYIDCASILDKYRINPGNVGFGAKRDKQFEMMIEVAIKYSKPVRIGVNWGSLDQDLATKLMDDNLKLLNPKPADEILRNAITQSALTSALMAEKLGLASDKIILSCKVSKVGDLIKIYQDLAKQSQYALHLGLTEAGIGSKGIVASSAALAILLYQGIGDTIRTSITPEIGESRTKEVIISQEVIQSLGLGSFAPQITSCPGCGRTTSNFFQELASKIQNYIREQMPSWRDKYLNVETMNIAVMGCIVNGPGESKHADIGISLPGTGEEPSAPVFTNGVKTHTLKGANIAEQFIELINKYIKENYKETKG